MIRVSDHVCGYCRDFPNGPLVSPKEWLAICQIQGMIERAVLLETTALSPRLLFNKGIYDWS
jgi:hypothetical protein